MYVNCMVLMDFDGELSEDSRMMYDPLYKDTSFLESFHHNTQKHIVRRLLHVRNLGVFFSILV